VTPHNKREVWGQVEERLLVFFFGFDPGFCFQFWFLVGTNATENPFRGQHGETTGAHLAEQVLWTFTRSKDTGVAEEVNEGSPSGPEGGGKKIKVNWGLN